VVDWGSDPDPGDAQRKKKTYVQRVIENLQVIPRRIGGKPVKRDR